MLSKRFSRRDLLKGIGIGAAGMLLAACGTKAEETKVAEVAATPASKEPTPLLFWFQAENHKPEYDRRQAEFEEKFNVKITYELLGRDAMTKKFPTTLMAGSGFPDIIEQNADDIVKFLKGDDNQIPFVDLSPAYIVSPYNGQVLEARFDRYSKDGKKYGAPHDVHPIIMIYNDTEWKKFNVDLSTIKTYDDLLAAEAKLDKTLADGSPRIGIYDCNGCATFLSMMLQKGVWWTDKATEPQLTTPQFKEAVETWYKFKDYWSEIDWANNVAMMKKGQIMAQFIPDWFFGIYKQGLKDDAEWGKTSPLRVMQIPQFTTDTAATGSWGGTAVSVPKLCKIRDLAINVLLYAYFENGEKQLEQRFTDIGILPPVKTAWTSDLYKQPEGFLAGQVAGTVYVEAAGRLPSYSENWKTSLVSAAWGEQAALVWGGSETIDNAITAADTVAKENITKNE
jgi:arabinosaccharide transport system substrate-binding protein